MIPAAMFLAFYTAASPMIYGGLKTSELIQLCEYVGTEGDDLKKRLKSLRCISYVSGILSVFYANCIISERGNDRNKFFALGASSMGPEQVIRMLNNYSPSNLDELDEMAAFTLWRLGSILHPCDTENN